MKDVVYLILAVCLASYSNVIMKFRALAHRGIGDQAHVADYLASMVFDRWVWTAVASIGLAGVLWLQVLRQLELSVAQPAMALVFVLVPLAAWKFLGEPMPPMRVVGLLLIIGGIVLVSSTANV